MEAVGVSTTASDSPAATASTNGIGIPYWSLPGRVMLSITMILIMAVAIFGNALVILVIARNRGMQTRTNFFLMNLAVADFLCGCIDMPFSLITVIRGEWIFNHNVCELSSFATPFFFVASIHTLMYIAVFKFLTIHNPFRFALSRGRILMMIVAAWTWAAIMGTLSVVGLSEAKFEHYTTQCGPEYGSDPKSYAYFGILLITCYAVPLCVIIFCYVGMFKKIRSHGRRLRDTSIMDREKIYVQQKGILVTLLVVVAAFIVTWTPWAAYSLYAIVKDVYQVHWINPITFWLGYANSACNPIIYALRNQKFREGYRQIVTKKDARETGYLLLPLFPIVFPGSCKAANRSSDGAHVWRTTTRTDSSFLRRTSTKEKSKFAYSLPTRRRLSSGGSLPDGFVTGGQLVEYVPLSGISQPGNAVIIAAGVESMHHETHVKPHGHARDGHRESRRTRHRELDQERPRKLSPSVAADGDIETAEESRARRPRSKRHRKDDKVSQGLKSKPTIKEFQGLSPNLKKWLISRDLGRQTDNPNVIEVFTDAVDVKKLPQTSSAAPLSLTSNVVKEYSRSVCSLCSNPECDTNDAMSQNRKSLFGHVKTSQCKNTPHIKTDSSKPLFYRYPSVDELDETRPKRHKAPSARARHRNPLHRVEKWYHHRIRHKFDLERQDLEQGQPLNHPNLNDFDHIFPGMFRSSSAPCL